MSLELLSYAAFFLTMALTYGLICLGLNVQWGQTGVFNVGISGFVAMGAYVSALLTTPPSTDHLGGFGLPIVVGWVAAALASSLLSFLIGVLTIRLLCWSAMSAMPCGCSRWTRRRGGSG